MPPKVIKDMSILVGDSAAQFDRFGDNLSQSTGKAKEDLTGMGGRWRLSNE